MRGSHSPETDEYGISSFVYRTRVPFHPERLQRLLGVRWPGVLRAKGWTWVANRTDLTLELSRAGRIVSVRPVGWWWAAMPTSRIPTDADTQANIASHWAEPWGYRRTEIVLIGSDLDIHESELRGLLDSALLTDRELHLGPSTWSTMTDVLGLAAFASPPSS